MCNPPFYLPKQKIPFLIDFKWPFKGALQQNSVNPLVLISECIFTRIKNLSWTIVISIVHEYLILKHCWKSYLSLQNMCVKIPFQKLIGTEKPVLWTKSHLLIFISSIFSGLPNKYMRSIFKHATRPQCHMPLQLSLAKTSSETKSLLLRVIL